MINHDLALYLVVTGYGDDPQMITRALGIPPTVAWVRGDAYSEAFPDARRTRSQWMLASGLPREAPFREHCEALLAHLEPLGDRLNRLTTRCTVGVVSGGYFHTGNPDFFIDEGYIRRFRALGLDIRFDQLPDFRDDA